MLEQVFSSILETRKEELIEFNGESDHVIAKAGDFWRKKVKIYSNPKSFVNKIYFHNLDRIAILAVSFFKDRKKMSPISKN